jgi:hypothetical protein
MRTQLRIRIRIILGSWIRIHIKVESWIRIRIKVKAGSGSGVRIKVKRAILATTFVVSYKVAF